MHDDDMPPYLKDETRWYLPASNNAPAYVLIFYEVPWAYDPTLRVPVSALVSLN